MAASNFDIANLQTLARTIASDTKAEVEVYGQSAETLALRTHEGTLTERHRQMSKGIGVRVFGTKGVVFFGTNRLDAAAFERLREAVTTRYQRAARMAAAKLPADPGATIMPQKVADASLLRASEEEKIELASMAETTCYTVDVSLKREGFGAYQETRRRTVLVRSDDFTAEYEDILYELQVGAVARSKDGGAGMVSLSGAGRDRRSLIPAAKLGMHAAHWARDAARATKPPSGTLPVIFDGFGAAGTLLARIIEPFINGGTRLREGAYRQTGKKIGAEVLSVVSQGTRRDGVETAPWDGDGLPVKDVAVIDQGRLSSLIYDVQDGATAKAASTHNAVRIGIGQPPRSASMNLTMSAGEASLEELLSGVKKGVYLSEITVTTVDLAADRFALSGRGRTIDAGELATPFTGLRMSGSITELLASIDAVGKTTSFQHFVEGKAVSAPDLRISTWTVG